MQFVRLSPFFFRLRRAWSSLRSISKVWRTTRFARVKALGLHSPFSHSRHLQIMESLFTVWLLVVVVPTVLSHRQKTKHSVVTGHAPVVFSAFMSWWGDTRIHGADNQTYFWPKVKFCIHLPGTSSQVFFCRRHIPLCLWLWPYRLSVRVLVRWATGKTLTNRLPKLSLITLSPPSEQRDIWSSYGAVRA